jgi:hypothetical protein
MLLTPDYYCRADSESYKKAKTTSAKDDDNLQPLYWQSAVKSQHDAMLGAAAKRSVPTLGHRGDYLLKQKAVKLGKNKPKPAKVGLCLFVVTLLGW